MKPLLFVLIAVTGIGLIYLLYRMGKTKVAQSPALQTTPHVIMFPTQSYKVPAPTQPLLTERIATGTSSNTGGGSLNYPSVTVDDSGVHIGTPDNFGVPGSYDYGQPG